MTDMGCCGARASAEETKKFAKGSERDISGGPLKTRGCTDWWCILIYVISWAAFGFVTYLGVKEGNPVKLFKPRDYQGAYCGIEDNWNNGPNLGSAEKLTYNMNVTSTVKAVADQMMCSSAVRDILESISGNNSMVFSQADLSQYRCACCFDPCDTCGRSLQFINLNTAADIRSVITARMTELTTTALAGNSLFSTIGANGDFFTGIWGRAATYFVQVCTKKCSNLGNSTLTRNYSYMPGADNPLAKAWNVIKDDASVDQDIQDTITKQFTFRALSFEECPYEDESLCIPMPGVALDELTNGYCSFKLATEVVDVVGQSAADAMQNAGLGDLAAHTQETFGEWFGALQESVDVLCITCVIAFVLGLVFLVLLRFLLGWVVWTSILLIFLLLLASGSLCYVRSSQCAGTSLLDSGKQQAVAIATVTQTAATNVVAGTRGASEDMSGDGSDYRGAQTHSRSGNLCQRWDAQTPHTHTYTPANFPDADLSENYCRNPGGQGSSIWCYTRDANDRWELCNPIGVIQGDCPHGYEVSSEDARKVLLVVGILIWCLAGLWFLLVCCLCSRIRLAIGVNKVAARYIVDNVTILSLPMAQAVTSLLWCVAWVVSVCFLLSQVPENYTPQEAFRTYAEAYGTDTEPGKCTDKAIHGFVYKDEASADCSGTDPKCWRCAPPRYIVDWRVAVSFFHFIWTNCFLVAFGQIVIAGAVGVWFFSKSSEKRKVSSVRIGWWNALRYHLGTVLFGACIIALVQFVRACLKYVEMQAKAQKNTVAVWVARTLSCVLWCWEQCLKFLNKNAYIQCALLGTNFCTSAKAAFFLILRHAIRFAAVSTMSGAVEKFGILLITIGTGVLGYLILRAMDPAVNPILPVIVYAVVGYMSAKLYMNVFGLAVASALQCFIATEEMGGDLPGDDSFVPGELKRLCAIQREGRGVEEKAGTRA